MKQSTGLRIILACLAVIVLNLLIIAVIPLLPSWSLYEFVLRMTLADAVVGATVLYLARRIT